MNQITYDLIKDKYGYTIKGHEKHKGEMLIIIDSSGYWDKATPSFTATAEIKRIIRFRIR